MIKYIRRCNYYNQYKLDPITRPAGALKFSSLNETTSAPILLNVSPDV